MALEKSREIERKKEREDIGGKKGRRRGKKNVKRERRSRPN